MGRRLYLNIFLIGYYCNACGITGPLALILMLLLYGPTYLNTFWAVDPYLNFFIVWAPILISFGSKTLIS